ncbi:MULTISPECIES: DUF3486 family protein [Pseudomonas]|uniref:DUF3486 family protein n=1 Tax=Pseudomonas TaxID=286 RepID=UPI000B34EBA7|nr:MULTISPECIES: DUF3486 family protein [Pseudomonas]PMY49121.1 DUF3486 domain-containing protein [Pseudomonas sp. FW305-53]PMY85656.1 DUF3486 domain-containing protein [Pseudomonas sp. FW303-C2]PMY92862.1 DUF3486 domain-containing protein [Pseudomonas sp. FW305-62]PNA44375.1 DUF3486 domain-containing protein [Pseudomonas sp. FW306-2-2C-A10BC]PNA83036.1 DUF3486 domain-containing protein [Pseudomonas sp. MPR-R3B]
MPPRSKVAGLPAEVKAWLDQALVESNFSGYELLSDELETRGYSIGKSALHRYGTEFEDKLAALKMSSEQAKAVVQAAPDDEGAVNEALMRLVQEHLFKLLMASDGKMDLPKVAKAVAELGRASVVQKKWQAEFREKAEAAAARVEKIAKKGGLNANTVDEIRREILGMAS